jgi:hypothetical protein
MAQQDYAERLQAVDLYLSKLETLLGDRIQGKRACRLLWLINQELRDIGEAVGREVAQRDLADQDLGDWGPLWTAVHRLEGAREKLLVRTGETFGLDARLLIAGDGVELAKLEYRLTVEKPAADTCNGATADEPLLGNRFRYAGQIHEMRPVSWKLLNELWGHDQRDMHDVEDTIWEVAGGSQLKDAQHDLKDFLESIGYPRYVSKARGSDSLVWKAF